MCVFLSRPQFVIVFLYVFDCWKFCRQNQCSRVPVKTLLWINLLQHVKWGIKLSPLTHCIGDVMVSAGRVPTCWGRCCAASARGTICSQCRCWSTGLRNTPTNLPSCYTHNWRGPVARRKERDTGLSLLELNAATARQPLFSVVLSLFLSIYLCLSTYFH